MPHVGARSVPGAELWRGRSPGEAGPCVWVGYRSVSAAGRGHPCLPRRRCGQPHRRGEDKGCREGGRCSGRCPRSRRRKATGRRFADGLAPMSAHRWCPCPGMSGRNLGWDGIHTVVELRSRTHRVLLGRVAVAVPTRPHGTTGLAGRQRRSAGRGTGHPILALLTSSVLRWVVESLGGGRRCRRVSALVSRGKPGGGRTRVRDPCLGMVPA
jgi:hypothetical protein